MKFSPCRSSQCTKNGTHCNGCGRSRQEIADTKKLISEIVSYAKQQDYDNFEEFIDFVSKKSLKKLSAA